MKRFCVFLCSFSFRGGRKLTKITRDTNFSFCDERKVAKERRSSGEGLEREKANVPHFLALRHPLPLRNPSPVGRADQKCLLIDRGETPLTNLSRSRDLIKI